MSGTSMLWIKRNLPDIYEKTRYFGHVNTLIAVMLSGNFAIDHSNASYTLLYETAGRGVWSEEICEKIGIDIHKLPPLVKSTDVVGNLIHPVLLAMGLSPRPRSLLAAGTPLAPLWRLWSDRAIMCESVGTTNVLTVCGREPKFSPNYQPPPCGGWGLDLSGSHVPHRLPPTSGYMTTSIRITRDYPSVTGKRGMMLMNDDAEQAEPGADGLVFLPI